MYDFIKYIILSISLLFFLVQLIDLINEQFEYRILKLKSVSKGNSRVTGRKKN